MELELITLYGLHHLGIAIFGKFELESPWWRWMLKWVLIVSIISILYYYFGHIGAMAFILIAFPGAVVFHFIWCKRNGIDPIKATPRKKYYELRGWTLNE
ncbi:MAG: hypothetical protein ACOYW3_05195 [Bacteroidota bacterium]